MTQFIVNKPIAQAKLFRFTPQCAGNSFRLKTEPENSIKKYISNRRSYADMNTWTHTPLNRRSSAPVSLAPG